MTDYGSFLGGAVTYPLPTANGIGGVGASFLRDADPAIFYVLEFYTAVIQRHVGPRLLAEAIAAGMTGIGDAVGDVIPFDPEPYLTERHTGFPLLSAARRSIKFEDVGGQRHGVSEVEVSYVLPPLQAGEAERLYPALKAVVDVIDNRTEQGSDPLYTPTGGSLGQSPWEFGGVATAEIKGATIGSLEASDDVFFPAVILQLEIREKSALNIEDLEPFEGANVQEDLAYTDGIEPTIVEVVEFETHHPGPGLVSAAPNSGSKAGGTSVTLTGTGFRVGTTPTVHFGGVAATNVVVASATSLTCVTSEHAAYTTAIVDVVVTNIDGQADTLVAGFTYTSP